jgi:hypothetical protein
MTRAIRKTIADWRLEEEETAARVRRVTAGFPKPYRRERPRAADEAQLLRERGTPERLIGPSAPEPGPDVPRRA